MTYYFFRSLDAATPTNEQLETPKHLREMLKKSQESLLKAKQKSPEVKEKLKKKKKKKSKGGPSSSDPHYNQVTHIKVPKINLNALFRV